MRVYRCMPDLHPHVTTRTYFALKDCSKMSTCSLPPIEVISTIFSFCYEMFKASWKHFKEKQRRMPSHFLGFSDGASPRFGVNLEPTIPHPSLMHLQRQWNLRENGRRCSKTACSLASSNQQTNPCLSGSVIGSLINRWRNELSNWQVILNEVLFTLNCLCNFRNNQLLAIQQFDIFFFRQVCEKVQSYFCYDRKNEQLFEAIFIALMKDV